ncbi:hypothetical protein ABPG75_008008 [Micractinium tetrahymenae]
MASEIDAEAFAEAPSTARKWEQTAHGKGRVRPRKNQPPSAQAGILRLTAVSHADAQHGEREGDPRPRYAEAQASGWLDYIRLDTPQSTYTALNKLWAHQPVLLQGAPLVAGLVGRWSFQQLARDVGSDCQLRVLCSDARRNRFIEYEDVKNIYGGMYHVREPETQRLEMSLPDFAQCSQQWRAQRLYLRGSACACSLAPYLLGEGDTDAAAASSSGKGSTPAAAGIDWEWLEGLQRAQRYGPVLRVDLEAGSAGGLLPASYESTDRLLAQVAGRRRVLLLPPEQAFEGLYPYPSHHPYDRYSMVDFEAPDAGLWPKFGSGVRGLAAVLAPGDVLYVPAYWFVHVQHLEAECIGLSFHLAQGGRAPSPEGTPLRLSRALEARVAEVEGPADVRHWLQVIGHGEEHEWIDLGTVKGYRRILFCQGVRDDVEDALGTGAWADLLPRMCEGRLVPTPWLNKDFREPLYLTDKPVVLEDTRSEEEKRYPELFRAKLEKEGWTVPKTVSTVPIPGVNMPKNADYRTYGLQK